METQTEQKKRIKVRSKTTGEIFMISESELSMYYKLYYEVLKE